jgi:urate oxidase
MTAVVGANRYGKASVRLLKVIKTGTRHTIVNYRVKVQLEGDFETSYTKADNSKVVPTDTTKNIVYGMAKKDFSSPEEYALILGAYFIENYAQVSKVYIDVSETPWRRMVIDV